MSITVRAHFDGKAIVPDEPLDLHQDQALEVELRLLPSEQQGLEQEPTIKGKPSIRSLPFFGMWADREDMTDSAAWVRKERERWDERLAG